MNPVSFDTLLEKIPNKYLLTMVVAARATQLEQGAPKKIETTETNSLDIAMLEIASDALDLSKIENPSAPKKPALEAGEPAPERELLSQETSREGN